MSSSTFKHYISGLVLLTTIVFSWSVPISNSHFPSVDYKYLYENFENPPAEYGVNCWWWWLNGNVNKTAITKDLEAMSARNFHGALIFDASGHNQRGNAEIPAGPLFGSPEWNSLFLHALEEARRLGLEISLNIQSGWNLGGPMITPEHAAKELTYSEVRISGEQLIELQLDVPESRFDYYEDIAVLAFPVRPEDYTLDVITDLELKMGFYEVGLSAPDTRFLLDNVQHYEKRRRSPWTYYAELTDEREPNEELISIPDSGYKISKQEIIDISSKMDDAGNLLWHVPEGEWVIMRIGYTCTDSHISTSSGDWQGLVLDYFDKAALDFYWKDVVEPILEVAGDHAGTTLKNLSTDSWECGGMNWTHNFVEEFQNFNGYNVIPYLPVIGGYIIDDIETSNAFAADFRKTLGHLVAHNHYKHFADYAHSYNMGIQPESAGPHAGPFDGIKNYGFSDVVMSEFWSPSLHRPEDKDRFYVKQAASAAHIYGKRIVGAESFTTIGHHWNDELWHDQKPAFDHEVCSGLNRAYFHTFTCSPAHMGLPGQEYFAGTHVNPQVTWWNQSGPFIDHMHRTHFLVQNGRFVADVLYYYGDHVPNVFSNKGSDPGGALPGFDYDVTDETVLLRLEVDMGDIITPSGMRYKILVLPDHRVMSLQALRKVGELIERGATVLGNKPRRLVSLVGGKPAQQEFQVLCDRIWGYKESIRGEKDYGHGLVVWGYTARELLLSKGLVEDFNPSGEVRHDNVAYIHYTVGETHFYFLSNQTTQRLKFTAQFRVNDMQPELWDSVSGERRLAKAFAQEGQVTKVPLTLEPHGSVFVIFKEPIESQTHISKADRNHPDYQTIAQLEGSWDVYFDTEWGGPAKSTFSELTDWSLHQNPGIKYYSGSAVYRKRFQINHRLHESDSYFIELGQVKDVGIAEVTLNGEYKGIVWTAPFRVDISSDLREGENMLEVKVVNSWYNRVAGDQLYPEKKQYTTTNIRLGFDYRGNPIEDIPLEPSGLLGPVLITKAIW